MLAFAKTICTHTDLISFKFKCCPQMSGIKSLAYNNITTQFNIEASIHMYNIGRNVRSIILWKLRKLGWETFKRLEQS